MFRQGQDFVRLAILAQKRHSRCKVTTFGAGLPNLHLSWHETILKRHHGVGEDTDDLFRGKHMRLRRNPRVINMIAKVSRRVGNFDDANFLLCMACLVLHSMTRNPKRTDLLWLKVRVVTRY